MARPGRFDITAYRGDAYDLTITLTDDSTPPVPLDTSTTEYFAQWRANLDDPDPVFEDFTVTVLSPGVLRVSLSSLQTTRMFATGHWDLEQRPPLTGPRTLLAGAVAVVRDVTHLTVVGP